MTAAARIEDERLLTGRGRFVADLQLPGMLHASFVRSMHAHGRVRGIDARAARAMPGVVAVYLGEDLVRAGVRALGFHAAVNAPDGGPMAPPPRHALALDVVRHVGEAIAIVVAENSELAHDAAEALDVELEPLPAACSLEQGKIAALYEYGDRKAVDDAMRAAAHVVTLRVVNQRVLPSALEPRGCVAEWDHAAGRLTVHASTQTPHLTRRLLAEALALPERAVRVLVGDIGGGFGSKVGLQPEDAVVAWAARALGRPVKWVATRGECCLADMHGRDHTSACELALGADGRFLALRVRDDADLGAYVSYFGAAIATRTGNRIANGAYHIPAIHAEIRAVLTNTPPTGPYRGAGRPETLYRLERVIDVAAATTGMDAVALRRRNFVSAAQIPYTNVVGQVYDSGNFRRVLDAALERSDWDGFPARRNAARARGMLLGRGLAYHIDTTSGLEPSETATVQVSGAKVTVLSGTQAMGQGLETVYTELVCEALGVRPEQVSIVQGDTDRVPSGVGSYGSRSLYIGGSAIVLAARAWLAQGARDGGSASATATSPFCFPNGCHVCEVEIDPDTGTIRIARYTAVDDVGRVVHPVIVEGQAWGGVVQGIGQALMEHAAFDAQGQLLAGSFMDYALPRADTLIAMDCLLDQSSPSTTNLLGAKGAGESGAVGAPPAVVSAVADALRELGVHHIDMPLSPQKIWRIIRAKEEGQ
jgi:aerobic carbon-monoxide dehydrogenase large subunit